MPAIMIQKRLNMPAILVTRGTNYAGNLDYDRDQICLQSWFKRGPRLQAYLVPIVIQIAGIFGPYHNQNCRYKWSPPI